MPRRIDIEDEWEGDEEEFESDEGDTDDVQIYQGFYPPLLGATSENVGVAELRTVFQQFTITARSECLLTPLPPFPSFAWRNPIHHSALSFSPSSQVSFSQAWMTPSVSGKLVADRSL